jgi:hypothetical protein
MPPLWQATITNVGLAVILTATLLTLPSSIVRCDSRGI